MFQKLRPRSVYDVMAAIACFGVLAGGTAYAANTIGSADVIDESLLSVDIKNGQVAAADTAANSVNSGKVIDNSLKGTDIDESTLAGVGCQGNGSGDTMVSAGAVCIDKYEVSVWSSPTGGTQYGATSDNYPCNDNGRDCTNIYARSVSGVKPSSYITYFQAQQALANVGKRLPSNAEWQQAVAGTPDPGPDNGTTNCRTTGVTPVNTGSRSACVSRFGAFDMVGNLDEWVGDWAPASTACPGWGTFSGDGMCLSGASTTATFAGALTRGGHFTSGSFAGPLAVEVDDPGPTAQADLQGFRGAR